MFKLDTGRYPSTEDGLEALVYKPYGSNRWNGPYLRESTINALSNFNYENNRNQGGKIELDFK